MRLGTEKKFESGLIRKTMHNEPHEWRVFLPGVALLLEPVVVDSERGARAISWITVSTTIVKTFYSSYSNKIKFSKVAASAPPIETRN